jgi:hypothetical protein
MVPAVRQEQIHGLLPTLCTDLFPAFHAHQSSASFSTTLQPHNTNSGSVSTPQGGVDGKHSLTDDPFRPLKPHYEVVADTSLSKDYKNSKHSLKFFGINGLSWSSDGKWLVGVGDIGMIVVFHRDEAV